MISKSSTPVIWLIVGDKLGDNAQVEALAEKLALPVERKTLRFKEQWIHGKPRFEASLHHLDAARSDSLEPPWPDLVLTIGRRPAMAALWVKRQSGGRTKLALIGRPKRYFDEFDLVIVTSQYRVPDRPNVLKIGLPLMRARPEEVARAADQWRDRLASMPRPLTAVLVGGATKPFRFEPEDARELLRQVLRASEEQGSFFITTSRRTSEAATNALAESLPANGRLFRWQQKTEADENPYLPLLGLADRFVVTGDSISMMVEVARLGKPLCVAPLPLQGKTISARLAGIPGGSLLVRLVGLTRQSTSSRDYFSFYDMLRTYPHVNLLAEGFPEAPEQPELPDSAEHAAFALRDLLYAEPR